jgi:hypothetical protein
LKHWKLPRKLFFIVITIWFGSCDSFGCNPELVAELTVREGNVERDFAAHINVWEDAPVKARFVMNDGVRTLSDASAELTLVEGSLVVMQPNTQLRFSSSEPESNIFGVKMESGSAQVEANTEGLQIETGIGIARLNKGTAMTLSREKNQLSVQLDIGTAEFVSNDGTRYEVTPDNRIVLDIGSAQLISETAETTDSDNANKDVETDDTETDDTGDSAPSTDIAGDEDTSDRAQGDSRPGHRSAASEWIASRGTAEAADFAIHAGENVIIHAVHEPVAIEFNFSSVCKEEGHVRILRKKIWGKGQGTVILNLPHQKHRYEVRCIENGELGRVKKHGRILVQKDKGKSHLSRTAPTSYVEADGRNYNVLYQSKLPLVVIRWPDAPTASQYKLFLTDDSGTRTLSSRTPQYRFQSGALNEGAYRFKFMTADQAKRSRTSSIRIRFDNATPKAILKSPKNGSFASGATVEVTGIALPGWTASVYGNKLPMDAQHRFAGSAQHRSNYLSLPVKLSHAKRGTHYFLRRAR